MYKLVTTAKKSCADPTIVPNGPKPFSKHYSNNNIVFFFFWGGGGSFSSASNNTADRYYRKKEQLNHWVVDREVKEEKRPMFNS